MAPTTVHAAPTLPPDGPVVTIIGRVGPCDFGSECLLAGFTIHNFDSQPTEFVCEFADGSRYTFHFNRQEVERACATGDPTDSITIEVGGRTFGHVRAPIGARRTPARMTILIRSGDSALPGVLTLS